MLTKTQGQGQGPGTCPYRTGTKDLSSRTEIKDFQI